MTKSLSERYVDILNKMYGFEKAYEILRDKPSVQFGDSGIYFPIDREQLNFSDLYSPAQGDDFELDKYLNSFSVTVEANILAFTGSDGITHFFSSAINERVIDLHSEALYVLNADGDTIHYFSGCGKYADIFPFEDPLWLLSLFLIEKGCDLLSLDRNAGWESIYKNIGPFIISKSNKFLDYDLYRYGVFTNKPIDDEFIKHRWENINKEGGVVLSSPKPEIPSEAIDAYKEALRISTTVDLSYINLFKVIEVLYAWGLKHQVNTITLDNVYNSLKEGSVTNEISMVKYIRQASGVLSLNYFTRDDFNALFPMFNSNKPKSYKALKSWLENKRCNAITVASDKADVKTVDYISEIIYYVRCALVHSKLDATEHAIRAPYNKNVYIALNNLVSDVRNIIDKVIY